MIVAKEALDEAKREFKLPKDEALLIEIGDKVAFGTRDDWIGTKVVGLRDGEKEVIYYVEMLPRVPMPNTAKNDA